MMLTEAVLAAICNASIWWCN